MQLPLEDVLELIGNAWENADLADQHSTLSVQQIEQIASIVAGKPITIDPADVQAVQQQAQQAAQQVAQQQAQMQQAASPPTQVPSYLANEPPAPPQPPPPPLNLSKKANDLFGDSLDKVFQDVT